MTNRFALFVLSFAVVYSVSAQNVMTPELLWKLGRVSGETITPDGKSVIYGVTQYNMEANKGERNLYSIPVTGGEAKQITSTTGSEGGVQSTPSGRMGFLFNGQWWEASWDGTNAKQISNIEGGIDNVKYSPDGKRILFSQEVKIHPVVTELYADLPKANAHGG